MSFTEGRQSPGYAGRGSGPRAGFWRRFAALIVDAILLGILDYILERLFSNGLAEVLILLISIGYFTTLEGGPRGQTVGKSALGIRVISLDNGDPIGYGRGFIRWVGRIVSTIFFFLGYWWMLWDRESQCWHDKFAGDVVVPVSAYPLPRAA